MRMDKDPRTLDLGCGSGRLIPVLGELGITRVVGVDFSEGLIRIAKARYPECDFRTGNILRLKDVVGEEKFDAFWAVASLMHILPEKYQQAVNNIREVVRVGAIGFITTPYGNGESLLDAHGLDVVGGTIPKEQYIFRNLWDFDALRAHFTLGGFRIVTPSFHDSCMIYMTVQAI